MTDLRSNIFYKIVIIVTLSIYAAYLTYRLLYTINPEALIFSIVFYFAELYGLVALFLYFFQMWDFPHREVNLPEQGLRVAALIPTYNEDISVIRKTALACMNVRIMGIIHIHTGKGCLPYDRDILIVGGNESSHPEPLLWEINFSMGKIPHLEKI